MNPEIHTPELVQRVNTQIQSRRLHNADELIEQALDAHDEKSPVPAAAPAKNIEELFAPLRGLNLDFSRNCRHRGLQIPDENSALEKQP